ncbi:uncharacterized protein LOC124808826 [Hydra vulgaris]|uniref:uncharacterized protein LOC124808826 n=1 Tax=Hydra vulgaris TaxID=6087 RepID=UPI0032EA85DA
MKKTFVVNSLNKESVSAGNCRELLNVIKNQLYNVNKNVDVFEKVYSLLMEASKLLNENTTHESGIPISQQQPAKYCHILDLPKRGKKMSYSNRCGIAKDKKKAGEKIKITTLDCPVVNVEEEVIIEDMDLDGLTSFNCNVPNKHVTPKEEFEKMITIKDNSQELYVLNLCCPITRQDLSTICNNEMLTDNIINAAQKMLLQQYPNTKGLQDPILGQNLSFAILKNEEFVQVLHDGCAHWFAISTVRCEPGHVFVMDSHFTGKLSHATMRQICSIIHCQLDKIKVTILPV